MRGRAKVLSMRKLAHCVAVPWGEKKSKNIGIERVRKTIGLRSTRRKANKHVVKAECDDASSLDCTLGRHRLTPEIF